MTQPDHLTLEQVVDYLAEHMPPMPPTTETIKSWARPSWRRANPHLDVPAPSGRSGRRLLWSRKDLDAWLARKREDGRRRRRRKGVSR